MLLGFGITWLKEDPQPQGGSSAKFIPIHLPQGGGVEQPKKPGREHETILNPEYPLNRVEMP